MDTLEVLDCTGHLALTWRADDPTEVAKARAEVARLKAAGYSFFLVENEPADEIAAGRGELIVQRIEDPIQPSEGQNLTGVPKSSEAAEEGESVKESAAPRGRRMVATKPMRGGAPITDQERRALDRDVAVLLGYHPEQIPGHSPISPSEWVLIDEEGVGCGESYPTPEESWRACPEFAGDDWETVADKLCVLGWLVILKQMPKRYPFLLTNDPVAEPTAKLRAPFGVELYWMPDTSLEDWQKRRRTSGWSYGDTRGEAICRAAKRVLGEG